LGGNISRFSRCLPGTFGGINLLDLVISGIPGEARKGCLFGIPIATVEATFPFEKRRSTPTVDL
jgi:hypothetical protein